MAKLADGVADVELLDVVSGKFSIRARAWFALIFACFDSRTWSSAFSSLALIASTSATLTWPFL